MAWKEEMLKRYYDLKQQQKELELEIDALRGSIIAACAEQASNELQAGEYQARIVNQERREYDDAKLYEVLPEASVWRLVSKVDPGKVAGLVKLNIVTEQALEGTYANKNVQVLQVKKI